MEAAPAAQTLSMAMPEQLPEGVPLQAQLPSSGSADSLQGGGSSGVLLAAGPAVFDDAQQQQAMQAAASMEAAAGMSAEQQQAGLAGPGADPMEPKRQICFDFTKNQCTRGSACKFSHDVGLIITVNSQEKGICFDFLKGLCTRGLLCRFSHDLRNLQTPQCTASSAKKRFAPICYDFVKNQCTRGEDCKYSHDYSSILYGPRAPGKDPYVICVDYTRGKCARGASCRYSHVDPRMLSAPGAIANPGMHPALLAAGLGAAAAAAAVAQTNSMAVPGALQGALAGLNAAAMSGPARQPSDLQAQAALLLSGLGGGGLIGAGLPGTPVAPGVAAGGIPAAWNGMPALPQNAALQQSPEGLAALLEQLQRTALTDSLAQLSPTAGDASLSAFNALMGGGVSPTYSTGLPTGGDPGLAASLLQGQAGPGGLGGMLDPQQAQQQQLFAPPGTAADAAAAAAAMLQGQLSDASQLGSGLPGSAAASAAPTPTAAGAAVAPTVFQQRGPSPPTAPLDIPGAGDAPAPGAQPKAQPLMSTVFHPMLQHKPGGGAPGAGMGGLAGFKAEILVDARSNNSPTIPASWGGAAAVEGAQQQQQQQPGTPAAGALPQRAQPPPVHVAPPQAGAPTEQLAGTPREIASSYDQMQLIWGQRSIWGQGQ